MKKLFTITLLLFYTFNYAQRLDLSVTPVGFFVGKPEFTAEYLVTDAIGLELALTPYYGSGGINLLSNDARGYTVSGFGATASVLLYTNEFEGNDGSSIGFFLRYKSIKYNYKEEPEQNPSGHTFLAAGVSYGFKYMISDHIILFTREQLGYKFSRKTTYPDTFTGEKGGNFFDMFAINYNMSIGVGYRL